MTAQAKAKTDVEFWGVPNLVGLTTKDKKYCRPLEATCERLIAKIPEDAKVLEIGPGMLPFRRADVFVDWNPDPNLTGEVVTCDMTKDRLPFDDKSFDFIYCRHVLEDMFDPFPLCAEMERVGKAGYIETPSALAEMCRGIDYAGPPFRGYHHHRWVVWVNDDELTFVSKYPIVEWFNLDDGKIVAALREGSDAWNTCYEWTDTIKVRHLQNPVDFFMPTAYIDVIQKAMGFPVGGTA